MKWFLVDKSATAQPDKGDYGVWKALLRDEAKGQCVYCAINEASFGGLRNFHVEHYRPKKQFPALTNDIRNLYYSCGICNSFKGSSWPGEPALDHSVPAYPCPSEVDYSGVLSIEQNYLAASNFSAGKFLIERLFLNRPQLVIQRRFSALRLKLQTLLDRVPTELTEVDDDIFQAYQRVSNEQRDVIRLLLEVHDVAPYEVADVKR